MRYRTKEDDIGREFLDGNPITIEGDAYNLIYRAVEATKAMVEGVQKLGESGLESVKYPDETLHEIVTNAVLHRDYSIVMDTQIRVTTGGSEIARMELTEGGIKEKPKTYGLDSAIFHPGYQLLGSWVIP